jgi:hypothetical protein
MSRSPGPSSGSRVGSSNSRRRLDLRIRTNDGAVFEGRDALSIVEAMRVDVMTEPDSTIEIYMRKTAARVREWNGKEIDVTSPEAFLATLEQAGMVRVMD